LQQPPGRGDKSAIVPDELFEVLHEPNDEFASKSFTEETGGDVMSILEGERLEATQEAEAKAAREKEDIARRCYSDGLDIATIARYMDLPITELEKLLLPKTS